ncbi:hypothetical protein PIB30_072408 [Stylosanthes scabra]|uniref:Uncharacterized protein n=1 Tax=Stylosanthes scabra TaxID=79078 RepID=A0ABU6RP27_9FABA|nr:hypothetical protein [Stylosanthes scabra]
MSEPPLLSIHYDSKITADHNGSVVFRSNQPLFIRMPRDVRTLVALKNFVAHAIGVQDTKRVTKIYYRYPMEVYGNFQFKRYRLRDDDDVKLIRGWHKHFSTILLPAPNTYGNPETVQRPPPAPQSGLLTAHESRRVMHPPKFPAPTVLPDTSAGTRRPAQPSPTTSGHSGQDPPTVVATLCELEKIRGVWEQHPTYHLHDIAAGVMHEPLLCGILTHTLADPISEPCHVHHPLPRSLPVILSWDGT